MKYSHLLVPLLSLVLVACDQRSNKTPPSTPPPPNADRQASVVSDNSMMKPDNTAVNVRDRDSAAVTPMVQSESDADRAVTQTVRKLIMEDRTISVNGKNVKVVTVNGVVTLRGPVDNEQERVAIEKKVAVVKGVNKVDNKLEVAPKTK